MIYYNLYFAIATTFFFSMNLKVYISMKKMWEQLDKEYLFTMEPYIILLVQIAPVSFLQIAIFLNINMWIRFYYKIDIMAAS